MARCLGPERLGQAPKPHVRQSLGVTSGSPSPCAGTGSPIGTRSPFPNSSVAEPDSEPASTGQLLGDCCTTSRLPEGEEGIGLGCERVLSRGMRKSVVGLRGWEGHLPTCFWPQPGHRLPGGRSLPPPPAREVVPARTNSSSCLLTSLPAPVPWHLRVSRSREEARGHGVEDHIS